MKKINKIGLLVGLAFFSGMNITNAAIDCDNFTATAYKDSFNDKTDIHMKTEDGKRDYKYDLYNLSGSNGETFATYCRNAGLATGAKNKTVNFTCKRVLGTGDDEARKAYDFGAATILRNGYSTMGSGGSLDSESEYTATNLALRIYDYYNPSFGDNNYDHWLQELHRYYADRILNENSNIRDLVSEIGGPSSVSYKSGSENKFYIDGQEVTDSILAETERLLSTALEKNLQYKNGNVPIVTYDKGTKASLGTRKKSVTYNLNVQNFDETGSAGSYVEVSFKCSDCDSKGVTYKVYANGQEIGPNPYDILKAFKNSEVEYKIEFDGTSSKYDCEDLNYEVVLGYFDEEISTEAVEVESEQCGKGVEGCQSFYFMSAENTESLDEIKDDINLCGNGCDELEERCGKGDAKACADLESKCASCTTYVSDPACSDSDTNMDIIEGTEGSNSCAKGDAENIKVLKCVIQKDATEATGHTNKQDLTKQQTYNADEKLLIDYGGSANPFCSVACKENFHLTLPGAKTVQSGRYFVLQASISGDKRCYTSVIKKGIPGEVGGDTFEGKYEEKRQELIKTWNLIKFKEAFAGASGSESTSTGGHFTHPYPCVNKNGELITCYKTIPDRVQYVSQRRYEFTFLAYDPSEKYNDQIRTLTDFGDIQSKLGTSISKNDQYGDHNTSLSYTLNCSAQGTNTGVVKCTVTTYGKSNGCEGKDGDHVQAYDAPTNSEILDKHIITSKTLADLSAMQRQLDEWEKYIKECSTWIDNVPINYNPELYFDYDEVYMGAIKSYGTSQMQGGASGGSTGLIGVCNREDGAVNEDYKNCTDGIEYEDARSNPTGRAYGKVIFNGSGIYLKPITDMPKSVGVATKTTYSKGDYITPTQFYTIFSTGAVTIGQPSENYSPIVNGLPVALKTTSGSYGYRIKVKKLGEYFTSGETGRVWNTDESNKTVVKAALAEGCHGGTLNENGYNCVYKVNCPDCPQDQICLNPPCCDGPCPVGCEDTVYCDKSNVSYRPITPQNTNPNDRNLGKNWRWSSELTTDFEVKAYYTTKEIEEDGELIYDVVEDNNVLANPNKVNNDFSFKFKMTPESQKEVQKYNKSVGSYSNNTLKCYDYVGTDGNTYKNIYCYSTFIDNLLYNSKTKKYVSISGNRIIGTDATSSDNLRKSKTQSSGYWTTWDEVKTTKWEYLTEARLEASHGNYKPVPDSTGSVEAKIGPSYK